VTFKYRYTAFTKESLLNIAILRLLKSDI
jgi:hypothetical protein